ncbi:Eukaryotic translation initiation factor 4B [Lithohypha guttulata]|nr:Eukaryotic translation initiation factor 4B [Lithohypha guttulata]
MAPKKNQKMSLGTFLQDDSYGSWADEMEDMPLPATDAQKSYGASAGRRDFSSNTGMGGASFERRDLSQYSVREQLPLPDKPPYTAHLANLSFDVTQDDIRDFFRDCETTNVRIVEDKMDRKPKGFGYVEFGTLDGLKTALSLSGSNLAGRQVRISVADPPKNDRPESNRDFSDWSRKGPLPELPSSQRRVSERNFNRNMDNMSDAGSERGSRRGFGADTDGKVRDFSNWERKGPLSPAAIPDRSLGGAGRQASKEGTFRRNSPSWGEGRSQEGSRPPRREYPDRPVPVREPTAAETDNQWRSKMRPDVPPKSPEPEASVPSSPAPPAAPATRPKLNLAKRTVSDADPSGSSAPAADTKASPFGAARPVDTAAKEREVEQKRQETIRLKKEADDKAKADRAEEKRQAREKPQTESTEQANDVNATNENGENDEVEPKPQPKFELLRRQASESNDMVADEDAEEDEAPAPDRDTAVKPKEVTRAPLAAENGAWRKAAPASEAPADSETAALQEDGWSTVSKNTKPKKQNHNNNNNRRSQHPRAIAS